MISLTLIFAFLFSLSLISAIGVDIPSLISTGNYSEVNVNNSQYLQGYTPATLWTWYVNTYDALTKAVADTYYAPIKWDYNQSTSTYNMWNNIWSSTYNASYVPYTGATTDVNLGSNDFTTAGNITTKEISVNKTLRFNRNKIAPNYDYRGGIIWDYGSQLLEQDVSLDAESRMLYLPNGDRFEVLNEAGDTFIWGTHGSKSELPNRTIMYKSAIVGSNYASTETPPEKGLLVYGNTGIGTYNPYVKLDIVQTAQSNGMDVGTPAGGLAIQSTGHNYGIFQGMSASGWGWLQVGRSDGGTTAYNYMMQSGGGEVIIGTTTDAGNYKLQVAGNELITSNNNLFFRDTGIYLQSSADGDLDIVADDDIILSAGEKVEVQNLNIGQNITFTSGAKIWSNSTCIVIESPDGSAKQEICNA